MQQRKRPFQTALADRLDITHRQAKFAPLRQLGLGNHPDTHTIFDRYAQCKDHHEAAKCRRLVFDIEKDKFVLVDFEARHFPLDDDARISIVQRLIDQRDRITDLEYRLIHHCLAFRIC